LDQFVLIAVAAAFFCGGVVKGVVGVGLPLTSIALMTTVIDLRLAIPLLVVPILTTNILQAFRGGRFLELLRQYWLMLVTAAIGVWAGTAALYRVELSYLLIILGLVVSAYSVMNLTTFRLSASEKSKPIWSPIVGFLSGILAGTTGSIGVPVVIYYQALKMAKDVFVQAVGIQFLITGSILTLALVYEGSLNWETLPVSSLAMIPAFIGMTAGQWVRNRVSEERFRTWLWIFMLVVGLNLVRKGLF
jgi:uncharacterized membrane protein YfcA